MIYDVVVVGAGIAGLMSAIEAKLSSLNSKVVIITKGNIFKSNSSMASGGINAVLDEKDQSAVNLHVEDTIKGGYDISDKKSIQYMCENASNIIDKLINYGVVFDSDENRQILQRSFGGGSSKRTCYIGDKTGSAIIQALIKKARSIGVEFLANNFIMNLTHIDNHISGVVALRRVDSSVIVYPAKAVILAGGGYAGIYRGFSTNAPDYTGDMMAIALRAKLALQDMEFVQFHPTGFAKSSYLASEAARGEGGYLVNSDNERFVNELDTRDVVSQAIYNQILNGKKVYIDLRHIDKDIITKKLPSLQKAALMQAGVDVSEELLEIKPVAHYTMGGIQANMTKTDLKGLFVCGECAVNQVHGANRLGGNSLLDGAVFGVLAGEKASSYIQNRDFLPIDYNIVVKDQKKIDRIFDKDTSKNFNAMRISLGKMMFEKVGINRTYDGLIKAFDYIKYLRKEAMTLHCINKERTNNVELIAILELQNALQVSESIILSAIKREESRGAHHRIDCDYKNDDYNYNICIKEPKRGAFHTYLDKSNILTKIRKFLIN
jgi:succinate dehydrogenase/fumarate reductase flavoprotein subunit